MCSSTLKTRSRRILAFSMITSSILLVIIGILMYKAIEESDNNYKIYNKTILIATEYFAQPLDCYGLSWRAFVVAEYDAVDRNLTTKHYKQIFRRVNNNEICGFNKQDAIRNASIIWPLTCHKESYYLIDDPTVLIGLVSHGEIYIIFAILNSAIFICVVIFTIVYIWTRERMYIRLQFSD